MISHFCCTRSFNIVCCVHSDAVYSGEAFDGFVVLVAMLPFSLAQVKHSQPACRGPASSDCLGTATVVTVL